MQKNCPAVYLLFAKCKLCVCVCVCVWVCLHVCVCVCMCVMCVTLHCSPAPIKKHSILMTWVLWSAWQTPECDDGKTESCGHWSWVAFPEADPDPDLLVLPALPSSPFQPKESCTCKCSHRRLTGGGDSSVVRVLDSWLKGCGFESLLERWENFLLQGRLSVLTLISVSVPPPCYRSST